MSIYISFQLGVTDRNGPEARMSPWEPPGFTTPQHETYQGVKCWSEQQKAKDKGAILEKPTLTPGAILGTVMGVSKRGRGCVCARVWGKQIPAWGAVATSHPPVTIHKQHSLPSSHALPLPLPFMPPTAHPNPPSLTPRGQRGPTSCRQAALLFNASQQLRGQDKTHTVHNLFSPMAGSHSFWRQ